MTSKERVLLALDHKETGRLPCDTRHPKWMNCSRNILKPTVWMWCMTTLLTMGCAMLSNKSKGIGTEMKQLEIVGKSIDLEASELLFEEDFSSGAIDPGDWVAVGAADWTVRNGALVGSWPEDAELRHGQIFSRKQFQGDILMEFDARTVPPSDHDIIWWWGTTLNEEDSHWDSGYLAGLGGWWSNKSGVEKIEGDDAFMAMTPMFKLEPGKQYRIQCGMIGQGVFIFANGELIMEFNDPKPFAKDTPGRIGFGIFQSHVEYSNLKVYKPKWTPVECSY